MLVAAIAVSIALVMINSYATWLVLHEDAYEPTQKTFQVAIIWFMPIVGAIIFAGLILTERRRDKPKLRPENYGATEFDGGFSDHSSDSSDSN